MGILRNPSLALLFLLSACGQGTATTALAPIPTDRAIKLCDGRVYQRNQEEGVLIPFGTYWLVNGSVDQTGVTYNLFKDAILESKSASPKCKITIQAGRISAATENSVNVNLYAQ